MFQFLSEQVTCVLEDEEKEFCRTSGKWCSALPSNLTWYNLITYSHKEAHLLLHTLGTFQTGFNKVNIQTLDTSIALLSETMFRKIKLEETGANDPQLCSLFCFFFTFTLFIKLS